MNMMLFYRINAHLEQKAPNTDSLTVSSAWSESILVFLSRKERIWLKTLLSLGSEGFMFEEKPFELGPQEQSTEYLQNGEIENFQHGNIFIKKSER